MSARLTFTKGGVVMTFKEFERRNRQSKLEGLWLGLALLAIFAATLVVLLVSSAKAEDLRPLAGTVTEVLDGDTVKVEVTVRLDEVDCPEKNQLGGSKSIEWMRDNLRGEKIFLVGMKREFYGRILAHVRKRGLDVGEQLVGKGLCWQYKSSKDEELKKLQEDAREKKIGIWESKSVQEPWEFRKRMKEEAKKARESIPVDDDDLENSEPTFEAPSSINNTVTLELKPVSPDSSIVPLTVLDNGGDTWKGAKDDK